MAKRDPRTFPRGPGKRLGTLIRTIKTGLHVPHIGVTQGGSSRSFAGAKPAATDGLFRPQNGEKK